MKNNYKIQTIYRIEGGILDGTELEPIMAFLSVKYPHRKSKDLYIPPIKIKDKEVNTWHCCQENCPNPEFEGDMNNFIEHLLLHKGRLVKPWNKKQQLKSPLPAVKLPDNPWENKPSTGLNEDRRFCLDLYISDIKRALHKQGIEVLEIQ